MQSQMLVTTTQFLDGYRVREYLGVVRGITVRTPTISQGIMGGLKTMLGGKISEYVQMCEQARQEAYTDMIKHAVSCRANAIIGVAYDASDVGQTGTEVICYGTAVILEKNH